MNVKLSVIIPTYYSWQDLKQCVEAILVQEGITFAYEIVIANNAPADCKPSWLFEIPNLKVVDVGAKGSYSARNAAVMQSSGSILCFTDSDCVPSIKWLSVLYERISNNQNVILAGAIEMFPKDKNAITAVEAYDIAVGLRQDIYAKRKGTAATANLTVLRSHFDSVSGFDPIRLSGGDTDFCKRLSSRGVYVEYVEDAVVRHPARDSLPALTKKARRLAGGKASSKGLTLLKNSLIMVLPPIVRVYLVLSSELSFFLKLKALGLVALLKAIQLIEFYSVILGKPPER